MLEDLRAGVDATGGAHQVLEQAELPRRQLHASVAHSHFARNQVHDQLTRLQQAELLPGDPAQQRLYPRDQLFHEEGLGDVVIGAQVEAFEALVEFGAGGEHDDRDGVVPLAQLAQDAQAVPPRQHDVEHDHIVALAGRQLVGADAVGGEVHGVALFLEGLADEAGDLLFIFRDQNAHAGMVAEGE